MAELLRDKTISRRAVLRPQARTTRALGALKGTRLIVARLRTASAAPTILPTTRCLRARIIARRGPVQVPRQTAAPMSAAAILTRHRETQRVTIAAIRRKLARTQRPAALTRLQAVAMAAALPPTPAAVEQLPAAAAGVPRMAVVVAVLTGIAKHQRICTKARLFRTGRAFCCLDAFTPGQSKSRFHNSLRVRVLNE